MAQDQGRALKLLYDICHGKGLPGPCHPKQRDCRISLPESFTQSIYCARLVAGRFIWSVNPEFHATKIAKYRFFS